MLEDARFIRTLQLRNLLSFGPDTPPIELGPLNVLIGPNGSGKSNVIEAIDLLRASATDLVAPVRAGGGTEEWLWKGVEELPTAEIDATLTYPDGNMPLQHQISFTAVRQRFELFEESIANDHTRSKDGIGEILYCRFSKGYSDIIVPLTSDSGDETGYGGRRQLSREDLAPNQSVLSQLRDPDQYPEITYLGDLYRRFKLYRVWNTGGNSALRKPHPVDQPNEFLAEDASNLGLVLNSLDLVGKTRNTLNELLAQFYDQFERYSTSINMGTVQVFFHEKNLHRPVSATRLSDGTLRFLCLASILCHPTPPPLICIEEPEIGLHPDILPLIAEMLIEASQRTQIIVTTHSDIIVDALSHEPESILVCEKESNATTVRRLNQERLREWLNEYSLGDLWLRGKLGGNRW